MLVDKRIKEYCKLKKEYAFSNQKEISASLQEYNQEFKLISNSCPSKYSHIIQRFMGYVSGISSSNRYEGNTLKDSLLLNENLFIHFLETVWCIKLKSDGEFEFNEALAIENQLRWEFLRINREFCNHQKENREEIERIKTDSLFGENVMAIPSPKGRDWLISNKVDVNNELLPMGTYFRQRSLFADCFSLQFMTEDELPQSEQGKFKKILKQNFPSIDTEDSKEEGRFLNITLDLKSLNTSHNELSIIMDAILQGVAPPLRKGRGLMELILLFDRFKVLFKSESDLFGNHKADKVSVELLHQIWCESDSVVKQVLTMALLPENDYSKNDVGKFYTGLDGKIKRLFRLVQNAPLVF